MIDSQRWLWIAGVLLLGWLLYLLHPILSPFLIGVLLAYMGDPLVDRFERWKLSRTWGVVAVFALFTLIITALVLVLVPMLEQTPLSYIQQKWRQRPLTTKRRGALGQSVFASCVWCSTGNTGEVTRERVGWYITKGCSRDPPAAWEPLRVTIHKVHTHPVFVPWGSWEVVPAKGTCGVWAARIWQLATWQNIR